MITCFDLYKPFFIWTRKKATVLLAYMRIDRLMWIKRWFKFSDDWNVFLGSGMRKESHGCQIRRRHENRWRWKGIQDAKGQLRHWSQCLGTCWQILGFVLPMMKYFLIALEVWPFWHCDLRACRKLIYRIFIFSVHLRHNIVSTFAYQ